MPKILFAEDTADLNRVVTAMLVHEGYEVDSALDGEAASNYAKDNEYDAIVLDIMMPKKDGLTVLSEIRDRQDTTPVMMLTAKAEIDDRVKGLDMGANDYLSKPFAMKELLARLRAMIRTDNSAPRIKELSYCDLKLDSEDFSMSSTNTVRLSPKEFELMRELIQADGEGIDSATIAERLWKDDENAGSQSVFLYISYLRAKLESISSNVTIEGEEGGRYILRSTTA